MTTFAEIFAPAQRDVHLRVRPDGNYGLAPAPGKGVLTIESVPNEISAEAVILQMNGIVLWGDVPDRLSWSAIATLPIGKLLRCRRDSDRGCVTADLPHWTGESSIGGYWR